MVVLGPWTVLDWKTLGQRSIFKGRGNPRRAHNVSTTVEPGAVVTSVVVYVDGPMVDC